MYVDRLAFEEERARRNKCSFASAIRTLKDDIEEVGDKGKWKFKTFDLDAKTTEARNIFVQAAQLDLSLTCKMLDQDDLCLHSIEGELNALNMAIENDYWRTAYSLCRDMWMTPFTCKGHKKVPKKFQFDLRERDLLIFEKVCETQKEIHGQNLCNEIYIEVSQNSLCKGNKLDLALYWIAENGLVTLLHELKDHIDIDKVIAEFSGSTMLHIAALAGHTHMVEYLLHHGAKLKETIGDFSVADHAAMTKRKVCLMYICIFQNKHRSWLPEYEKLTKRYKVESIEPQSIKYTREDALSALSEPFPHGRTYEMLKKKTEMLNVKTFDDLNTVACESWNGDTMTEFTTQIKNELEIIRVMMENVNSNFKIKSEIYGPLKDGYEVMSFDTVHVIFEVNEEFISKTEIWKAEKEQNLKDKLINLSDFSEVNKFRKLFITAMKQIVSNENLHKGDKALKLVPPFLTPNESGVFLYWMWDRQGSVRFFRMHIKPVRKVKAPSQFKFKLTERKIFEGADSHIYFLLACFKEEYLYTSFTPTRQLMNNLSDVEKKVLFLCRFITQLIPSRWSYQRIRTHNLTVTWQGPSLIPGLHARILEYLFIEELCEIPPSAFRIDNICQRVLSILRRAIKKDYDGNVSIKEKIIFPFNPSRSMPNISESIIGIIKFIEDLPKY